MRDLGDHAAVGRRVGDVRLAADLVQAEALQRFALHARPADRARDLHERNRLIGGHCRAPNYESVASASTPWRRDWIVETLRLRRCATERGLSSCESASNVARIMLYGFEEPWLLATTSCTPSDSNTARIGPPAMMPVPAGAARNTTRPAPWRPLTS